MSDDAAPESDRADGAPHPRFAPKVFGHGAAREQFLSAMRQGRLHHAWLFTGASGIGKATLAWHLAKIILTGDVAPDAGPAQGAPSELSPTADTATLRRIEALSEPGLFLLRRERDRQRNVLRAMITVDDVRGLKGFFALSRPDNGWRVVIVDNAGEMNVAASNALLKILEEPPARTVFFLIADHAGRLLPTIRSRCRTLACQPLGDADLSQVLAQTVLDKPMSAEEIATLTGLVGGSAGLAIRMHLLEGPALSAQVTQLLAGLPGLDRAAALALCRTLAGREQEARRRLFLSIVATHLAVLAKRGAGMGVDQEPDPQMRVLSGNVGAARQWAAAQSELIAKTERALSLNMDPQAVLLDLFVQIDAVARRCAPR